MQIYSNPPPLTVNTKENYYKKYLPQTSYSANCPQQTDRSESMKKCSEENQLSPEPNEKGRLAASYSIPPPADPHSLHISLPSQVYYSTIHRLPRTFCTIKGEHLSSSTICVILNTLQTTTNCLYFPL